MLLSAPLRYCLRSTNINISAIDNHYTFRQLNESNPPQRKAENRSLQERNRMKVALYLAAQTTHKAR